MVAISPDLRGNIRALKTLNSAQTLDEIEACLNEIGRDRFDLVFSDTLLDAWLAKIGTPDEDVQLLRILGSDRYTKAISKLSNVEILSLYCIYSDDWEEFLALCDRYGVSKESKEANKEFRNAIARRCLNQFILHLSRTGENLFFPTENHDYQTKQKI